MSNLPATREQTYTAAQVAEALRRSGVSEDALQRALNLLRAGRDAH